MTKKEPAPKEAVSQKPTVTQSPEDNLDAYLGVVERIHRYVSADPQRLARFRESLTEAGRHVR